MERMVSEAKFLLGLYFVSRYEADRSYYFFVYALLFAKIFAATVRIVYTKIPKFGFNFVPYVSKDLCSYRTYSIYQNTQICF